MFGIHKETYARIVSESLVWLAFCIAGLVIAYLFTDDSGRSVYLAVISILAVYTTIGSAVMMNKEAFPPSSDRIQRGRIDLWWGVLHFYWSFWWPLFVARRG